MTQDTRPVTKPSEESVTGYYFSGVDELPQKLKELKEERQKDYGEPLECHSQIAGAWGAYLRQAQLGQRERNEPPIVRAYDVAMMFALAKIIRLGFNYKQDSLDDAIVYLRFAQDFAAEQR